MKELSHYNRFRYDRKKNDLLQDDEFWLDGSVPTGCNHKEICDKLNDLDHEIKKQKATISELISDVKFWQYTNDKTYHDLKKCQVENKSLIKDLDKFADLLIKKGYTPKELDEVLWFE